jgi:hypothetical protein
MLTKVPTANEWIALSDLGMTAFLFGMLLTFFGILFLEWWEIKPKIKSFFQYFIPKKSKLK